MSKTARCCLYGGVLTMFALGMLAQQYSMCQIAKSRNEWHALWKESDENCKKFAITATDAIANADKAIQNSADAISNAEKAIQNAADANKTARGWHDALERTGKYWESKDAEQKAEIKKWRDLYEAKK